MGLREILKCCCPCLGSSNRRNNRSKGNRKQSVQVPFPNTRLTKGGIKISSIEDDPDLIISPQEPVLPLKIPEKEKAPVYGITKAQVHPVPSWVVEDVAVEQIGRKPLSVELETVKRGNASHLFTRMDTVTDSMSDWLKRNSHIIDQRRKIDRPPTPNISNPVLDIGLASDPAVNEDLRSYPEQRIVQEIPTNHSCSTPKLEVLANSRDPAVRKEDVSNLNTMLWNELPFRSCGRATKPRSQSSLLVDKRKFRPGPGRFPVKNCTVTKWKEKYGSKDRNSYWMEKSLVFFLILLFLSVTFFIFFKVCLFFNEAN